MAVHYACIILSEARAWPDSAHLRLGGDAGRLRGGVLGRAALGLSRSRLSLSPLSTLSLLSLGYASLSLPMVQTASDGCQALAAELKNAQTLSPLSDIVPVVKSYINDLLKDGPGPSSSLCPIFAH